MDSLRFKNEDWRFLLPFCVIICSFISDTLSLEHGYYLKVGKEQGASEYNPSYDKPEYYAKKAYGQGGGSGYSADGPSYDKPEYHAKKVSYEEPYGHGEGPSYDKFKSYGYKYQSPRPSKYQKKEGYSSESPYYSSKKSDYYDDQSYQNGYQNEVEQPYSYGNSEEYGNGHLSSYFNYHNHPRHSEESHGYGYKEQSKGYEYPQPPQPQYQSHYSHHQKYSKSYTYPEEKVYTYEAITALNLNTSYHCGVIPDTNFELYQNPQSKYGKGVNDVAPFGKYPWMVIITVKNKLICTGVLIHAQHVLTSSDCVPEYQSLSKYRVRVGDWDVLTNYNEYEAYQNLDYAVCARYPVGDDYDYNSYGDSYNKKSGLVLLKIGDVINYDKRPHVKPICLNSNYAENYEGRGYYYGSANSNDNPEYSSYTHPIYQSDSKKDYSSYSPTSNCWVVGWYGSKKTTLKNHPLPSKTESYSYQNYYKKYYKGYDKSFIQKRAKVKQVDCPKDKSGSSYSKNSNYNYKDEDVCFVGVDGYDSCVADRGAAVFCVIAEKSYYDAGYTKSESYYGGQSSQNYHPLENEDYAHAQYHEGYENAYENQEQEVYQKDIKAEPSSFKPPRYRAVLYAIVKKPTKCNKKSTYYDYDGDYSKKQSKLVRATKVGYKAVRSILKTFWEISEDRTCPVPNSSYKEPKKSSYGYRGSNYSYKSKDYYNKY